MWQLISCKLIGTVRQPSVGRNLCCCGFRDSSGQVWVVISKVFKAIGRKLVGIFIACYFLNVWERLLGLFPSICDLINFNYWVKHALYYTQFYIFQTSLNYVFVSGNSILFWLLLSVGRYIPGVYSKRSPNRFDSKPNIVLSLNLLTNNQVENSRSLFM